jgi:hypothetical protein
MLIGLCALFVELHLMEERGLSLAYTTIMRWVHQYGPELDKRIRCHLKPMNDSWRVDECACRDAVRPWSCGNVGVSQGTRDHAVFYGKASVVEA